MSVTWYSSSLHVVGAAQARLLVIVLAVVSHCVTRHVESAEHTRLLKVPGEVDSY
jgi:hypothetical protein